MNPSKCLQNLAVLILLLVSLPLSAQAFCSGAACSSLPVSNAELNSFTAALKFQYADGLAEEMARATEAANLLGLPVGAVSIEDTLTLGPSLSMGYEEKHNVVIVSNFGSFTGIDSAGYGATPKFFLGANLGRAIDLATKGKWGDAARSNSVGDAPLSPYRFDLYLYYLKERFESGADPSIDPGRSFVLDQNSLAANPTADLSTHIKIDLSKGLQFSERKTLKIYTQGVFVRYRLLDRGRRLAYQKGEFLGLGLGLGLYDSRTSFELIQPSKDLAVSLGNGQQMIWNSFGIANYRAKVLSIPVELSSGIQFFSFLNLTAALGFTRNQGSLELGYLRFGNAYLQDGNLFSFLGATPDSYLGVNVVSDAKIRSYSFYLKPGLELDFPYFKIGFEGILTQEAEGLSFYLRFEI